MNHQNAHVAVLNSKTCVFGDNIRKIQTHQLIAKFEQQCIRSAPIIPVHAFGPEACQECPNPTQQDRRRIGKLSSRSARLRITSRNSALPFTGRSPISVDGARRQPIRAPLACIPFSSPPHPRNLLFHILSSNTDLCLSECARIPKCRRSVIQRGLGPLGQVVAAKANNECR